MNVLLEFPASSRHLRINFYCKCSADSEKCSVIIILESPFSAALVIDPGKSVSFVLKDSDIGGQNQYVMCTGPFMFIVK